MADINISLATRTTLLQVQRARVLIDRAAERLSTGKTHFVARSLTDRARNLLGVKDKISDAATTVGAAVAAIDRIIALVNQMRGVAVSMKGRAVSGAVPTTVTGNVVANAGRVVTSEVHGAKNKDSFDITHNGTTTTIVNKKNDTFNDLRDKINAISGLTATVSNGNPLVITAADGQDIVIANNVNDLATDLGLATSTNGSVASSELRQAAEAQFDRLRTQIDNLVNDTTILGKNLLRASPDSLTVKFNESGSSTVAIFGVGSDAAALAISAVDSTNAFTTDAGIAATVAQLDAAFTALRVTRMTLGVHYTLIKTRLGFTEDLITVLEEGSDRLINVDLDAESATLLALQTRHDMALGVLSLSFDNRSSIFGLLTLG